MNALLFANVENAWLLTGWTMIHFLWLGTFVALAALLSRWLLRRASANVRYVTALACLATLAALPIGIAIWLHQNPSLYQGGDSIAFVAIAAPAAATKRIEITSIDLATLKPGSNREISGQVEPAPTATQSTDPKIAALTSATAAQTTTDPLSLVALAINTCVQYLPWLWLIGTPITFALTATGLLGARRLRRASRPITVGPILETLLKLAASLRLTRRVAVAVCDRIAAPVLIGILRPIILLPPAALTGYSPDEIEMVLLHELAHVRRWDNLVNLIQRLVESLLFFHPAVWLVSSWVRRERESCCDALVVTRTDRPHAYAELLVALAAQMPRSVLFHPAASSAMAAGPLRSRIRRILKLDDDPMLISGKSFTLMVVALLAAAMLAVVYLPSIGQAEQSQAKATENTQATTPAEKTVRDKEKAARQESRDRLQKKVLEVQGELKHKYDDYLDIAKGMVRPQDKNQEPEIDLLLRGIVDAQKKVEDLTTGLYQLQTDYMIAKAELSDPALLEVQAEEVLKQDSQYANLQQQLEKARGAASGASDSQAEPINRKIENYRADFKKKAVREMHSKPNVPLQQLTQRFKTNAGSMQKQIVLLTHNLEQKRKELEKRVEKPANLETRGEELAKLQQIANDMSVMLESLAIDVEGPEKSQPNSSIQQATINNLKELSTALVNYTDTRRSLSHAKFDPNGKPLLSWRVLILPFLDEWALYNEFHPDEPWDSEHNRKLIARMPKVFKNPKLNQPDKTNYLAVVGKECAFNGTRRGLSLADFVDGAANTILLVEADQSVEWTKPEDWNFDRQHPTAGLGSLWHDHWYAAYADAHVAGIDNSKAPDVIGIDFTRAGREQHSLQESANRPVPERNYQHSGDEQRFAEQLASIVKLFRTDGQLRDETRTYELPDKLERVFPELGDVIDALKADPSHPHFSYNLTNSGTRFEVTAPRAVHDQFIKKCLAERNSNVPADAPSAVSGRTADRSKFPSLEEQKLADVAWKRLGVELEPIGDADLKRVKALGYDGGLKVVTGNLPNNGILVGLHVWPTTSLKDVAQILERDDVPELNPMKYYVITEESASDQEHPQGIPKDFVRTGRISIQDAVEIVRRKDNKAPLPPVKQNNSDAPLKAVAVPNVKQAKVADHVVAPSAPTNPVPARGGPNQITGRTRVTLTPAEAVFVAYDIPPDMKGKALQFFSESQVRSMSDDRGRYIVQADKNWHDHFAALLKATPKWNDPAAAKERGAKPLVMKKVDDEDILEWRSVGLSLKPHTEERNFGPANQRVVVVAEVVAGSPAAWADIRPDDTLTDVGSFKAGTMAEVQSLLKALGEGFRAKKTVRVRLSRGYLAGSRDVTADFTLGPEDLGAAPAASQASPPTTTKVGSAPIYKGNFRYEGKAFKDWQNAWQTELSTEKRIEAVKALAAFGANGYGPEAAESVLDVAGQCDFSPADSGNESKLKAAISDQLAPDNRAQSLAKYWVPILTARLEKDPNKWQGLTVHLLYHLRADDEATLTNLYSLGKTGPAEVRTAALRLLVMSNRSRSHGPKIDDRARALLAEALQSNDPSITGSALSLLLYYSWNPNGNATSAPELVFQKELVPLLFHPDEKIRQEARGVLRYISKEDAPPVIKQLVAVIRDKSRQKDHIHAVRGLAAMSSATSYPAMKELGALDEVKQLRTRTDDTDILIAALVAIVRISPNVLGDDYANMTPLLTEGLSDKETTNLIKKIGQPGTAGFKDRFMQEISNLCPSAESPQSGGGFF